MTVMATEKLARDVAGMALDVPAFDVRPGQLIWDLSIGPRGVGTLGVTFTRRVLEPAAWDHSTEPMWFVRCQGDVYFGRTPPLALPVLTDALGAENPRNGKEGGR